MDGMYTQENPGSFTRVHEVDLAVVGGGMAGTAAAIAGARLGLKTLLLQDRPVLGGPAGTECDPDADGRLIGGCADWCNRDARETGVIEDIRLEGERRYINGYRSYYSEMLRDLCDEEPNLELLLNTSVFEVQKEGDRITELKARTLGAELLHIVHAKAVADCTGDGTVGFMAGAEFRMGREASSEFNETLAPEKADSCTLGSSLYFRTVDVGHPVKFVPPKWACKFPDESFFVGRPHHPPAQRSGYYWIECGGDRNTITDNEEIRRDLLKILYGVWDHIKNHGSHDADNLAIDWIAAVPGKRESRRLMGDYILTETDETANRSFPDAVTCGGFNIDVHPVGGFFHSGTPSGPEHGIMSPGLYQIPIRCYYSKNVENLLMAGRNISVSHIALGSARVMATCAFGGQAAAALAAVMKKYGLNAREAASGHFEELRYLLYRIDHCLPGVTIEDPENHCADAAVKASSSRKLENTNLEGWASLAEPIPGAFSFVSASERINSASFLFQASAPAMLKAELVESKAMYSFDKGQVIASAESLIPAGESKVSFRFNAAVERNRRYIIRFGKSEDIKVGIESGYLPGVHRSNMCRRGWPPKGDNTSYCCSFEPEQRPFEGENVLNTNNRGGDFLSAWISDPLCGPPQTLEITFPEKRMCSSVELIFDTNLDSFNIFTPQRECVKEYRLEALIGGKAEVLAEETENLRRFRRHEFAPRLIEGLKLTVFSAWGVPEARVYQVRAYR